MKSNLENAPNAHSNRNRATQTDGSSSFIYNNELNVYCVNDSKGNVIYTLSRMPDKPAHLPCWQIMRLSYDVQGNFSSKMWPSLGGWVSSNFIYYIGQNSANITNVTGGINFTTIDTFIHDGRSIKPGDKVAVIGVVGADSLLFNGGNLFNVLSVNPNGVVIDANVLASDPYVTGGVLVAGPDEFFNMTYQ